MGMAPCCQEWGKESMGRERESLLTLLIRCVTPATPRVAMVPSQVAGMCQVAPHSNKQEYLRVIFTFSNLLVPCPTSCSCFLFLPTLSSKGGDDAQSSSSLEPANALPCASDLLVVTSFLLCCIAWNSGRDTRNLPRVFPRWGRDGSGKFAWAAREYYMKMHLIRKWGIVIKCCLTSSFIFCQDVVLSIILVCLKGLHIHFGHEGCDKCVKGLYIHFWHEGSDVQSRLFGGNFEKGWRM